jgi:threonine synthase
MKCTGCQTLVDPSETLGFSCPEAHNQPNIDHILAPALSLVEAPFPGDDGHANPFVRFRSLLFVYRFARAQGVSDEQFINIVEELDAGLEGIGEPSFRDTPLRNCPVLDVWAKDETDNVGQSHKARHLFLVMIYLKCLLAANSPAAEGLTQRPMAVASCGNAGLAAAAVARSANWPIDVYIPPSADEPVKQRLAELNARVHICERDPDTPGDPTVIAFRAAVANGSIPFSVQGCDNGISTEGSATLIWEAVSALKREGITSVGSVFIQVGGGALGAGMVKGLRQAVHSGALERMPEFNTVQTEGCYPLQVAYHKLLEQQDLPVGSATNAATSVSDRDRQQAMHVAAHARAALMVPWENPQSIAHGILDDETYDWHALVDGMLQTGGKAVVVNDESIIRARETAMAESDIPMCHTGAAGLAGVMEMREKGWKSPGPTLCVFSGLHR